MTFFTNQQIGHLDVEDKNKKKSCKDRCSCFKRCLYKNKSDPGDGAELTKSYEMQFNYIQIGKIQTKQKTQLIKTIRESEDMKLFEQDAIQASSITSGTLSLETSSWLNWSFISPSRYSSTLMWSFSDILITNWISISSRESVLHSNSTSWLSSASNSIWMPRAMSRVFGTSENLVQSFHTWRQLDSQWTMKQESSHIHRSSGCM